MLEKNRPSRIGYEGADGRQKNIAGAILHLDPAPKKGGITSHLNEVSRLRTAG
jgi:hypothetical protein